MPKYKCDICTSRDRFDKIADVIRHIRKEHGVKLRDLDVTSVGLERRGRS